MSSGCQQGSLTGGVEDRVKFFEKLYRLNMPGWKGVIECRRDLTNTACRRIETLPAIDIDAEAGSDLSEEIHDSVGFKMKRAGAKDPDSERRSERRIST